MVRTWFPADTMAQLQRRAALRADTLLFERGDIAGSAAPPERQIVNLLRHEYTDYDTNPTELRHQQACEAIAAAYPSLAAECARQVAQRAQAERDADFAAEEVEVQREQARQHRRQLVVDSRAAIGGLHVGQAVTATVRGHHRQATITKVGRTRVTIEFHLKDGQKREKTLPAALVTPECFPGPGEN